MGGLSLTHLLLILIIALIFFGPSRLPQLGQSLGKTIRGFKDALNEIDAEAKDVSDDVKKEQLAQNNAKSSQVKETEKNQKS